MNDSGKSIAGKPGDSIEELLAHAEPRLAPPPEDERYVRDAVKAEWRATIRRRTRRRSAGMLIAASVVFAAAVTFTTLRAPGPLPVEVATIDKSRGPVFFQTASSVAFDDRRNVVLGEILSTGNNAAVGLNWSQGGSLRIDENTRVEFVSSAEILLIRGRIYVDSDTTDPGGRLSIRTPHGTVSHLGTQYMTASDDTGLTVTVREGEVHIDGRYYDQIANNGQQVRVVGSARPTIVNVTGGSADWLWLEAVAPDFDVDGKSAYEFLQWVGRETGHAVEFESADAEQLARNTRLVGKVDRDPRTELRLRMMTMDMNARFDTGRSALIVGYAE